MRFGPAMKRTVPAASTSALSAAVSGVGEWMKSPPSESLITVMRVVNGMRNSGGPKRITGPSTIQRSSATRLSVSSGAYVATRLTCGTAMSCHASVARPRRHMSAPICAQLFDARQFLAAAQRAGTAFDPDGPRAELLKMAGINAAIVVVVELARPLPGSVGIHADEDHDADERPRPSRRIWIVLVDRRPAGLRIDVRNGRSDEAAQRLAAGGDADLSAVLGTP